MYQLGTNCLRLQVFNFAPDKNEASIQLMLVLVSLFDTLFCYLQILSGCCYNVFVLEKIIKETSGGSSVTAAITFCQFLGISIYGFFLLANFKTCSWRTLYLPKRKVPLHHWVKLVIMFFISSILNNMVLSFGICIPLHIILRSTGTVWSMIIGYLFFGKKYSIKKVQSGLLMSAGLTISLLGSQNVLFINEQFSMRFIIGITIMIITSIIGAISGIYNEQIFILYGKHWKESLFYTHILALPMFALISNYVWGGIYEILNNPKSTNIYGFNFPTMGLNVLTNVLSQALCVRGVNILASNASALTVTITLLLRKVFSLFISIVYFGKRLSIIEGIGFALVLLGTWTYSRGESKLRKRKND